MSLISNGPTRWEGTPPNGIKACTANIPGLRAYNWGLQNPVRLPIAVGQGREAKAVHGLVP